MPDGWGIDLWGVEWGGLLNPPAGSTIIWPDYLVFPAARRKRWETDPPPVVLAQPAAPTLGGHYAVESLSPGVRGHG